MIYDCIPFFNELDLLEIRLNTLNKVVDKFVIVEAPWLHTGADKPLFFSDAKDRFRPFLSKIIHVIADSTFTIPSDASVREQAWIRENIQRNTISNGLKEAKDDDFILISDLDEIPNPEKLAATRPALGDVINFQLRHYSFYLNFRNVSNPFWGCGPKLLRVATFRNPATYNGIKFSEYAPECANPLPSATLIRLSDKVFTIKDSGWHFTSIGGVEAIEKKIAAFAHTEFQNLLKTPGEIERRVKNGIGLFGPDRFFPEPLENGFPPFILANKERFAPLLLAADTEQWRKSRLQRKFLRGRKLLHDITIKTLLNATPQSIHPTLSNIRKKLFR